MKLDIQKQLEKARQDKKDLDTRLKKILDTVQEVKVLITNKQ